MPDDVDPTTPYDAPVIPNDVDPVIPGDAPVIPDNVDPMIPVADAPMTLGDTASWYFVRDFDSPVLPRLETGSCRCMRNPHTWPGDLPPMLPWRAWCRQFL